MNETSAKLVYPVYILGLAVFVATIPRVGQLNALPAPQYGTVRETCVLLGIAIGAVLYSRQQWVWGLTAASILAALNGEACIDAAFWHRVSLAAPCVGPTYLALSLASGLAVGWGGAGIYHARSRRRNAHQADS